MAGNKTRIIRELWGRSRAIRISAGMLTSLFLLWAGFKLLYPPMFEWYTGVTNAPLTFDTSREVTKAEFETLARELTQATRRSKAESLTSREKDAFARKLRMENYMNTASAQETGEFPHIKYFRDADIRQYKGPETCLACHSTMKVRRPDGTVKVVGTLEDVLDTMHFKFQSTSMGFTTYGYDGRKVNEKGRQIPVGKVDRACGIPGSFSWTGWAALVESKPAHAQGEVVMRSEGCGQCHIGGNYHPATEKMMPVGDVPRSAKLGLDCLICHSRTYDMNHKYVVKDANGLRWNQDRTLKSAMAVGRPRNDNCLNCHQHNLGGDAYPHNVAAKSLGYKNQRILHEGAKRASPFSPEADVHAKAGVQCLDCHRPQGHKIPRGRKGTDLVANDLPDVEVTCEQCHTATPHVKDRRVRAILNGHVDRVSCEACHIRELDHRSVLLRDWVNPQWNEEEGMFIPTDVIRTGKPGMGFELLWFNGNGTFLANALGDNPSNPGVYNPLMDQMTRIDLAGARGALDSVAIREKMGLEERKRYVEGALDTISVLTPGMREKRVKLIEENLRPVMRMGKSRLYPFKMFNAYMFEDMSNQGPFGAMILPYDYKTYYETGDTLKAMETAIRNPIVKRMYETPFKVYMMDEFMAYFGVPSWSGEYPLKDGKLRNIEPHWMRQMGTLMVNHGISGEGRSCRECHSPNGILDYERLGYPKDRARELENPPELKQLGI